MKGKISTEKKSAIEWGYLVLLGGLGFSMLGLQLIINVLHFPFFFIEWIYVPLIILYGKRIARTIKRLNIYHALLVLLLVFGMVYGILDSKSISSILDYRSIIYLIVVYRFIKSNGIKEWFDDILYICLFATASELSYILFLSDKRIVSSTNCLASSIAIIGFFVIGKYNLGLIAYILSLLTGILSGYRIGIIFAVFSLVIACTYNLTHNNMKKSIDTLKKVFYIVITTIVLIIFFKHYEDIILYLSDVLHLDQFAVFRITTRMKAIFQMDFSQSQDGARIELWLMAVEEFLKSLLPRGFIKTPGIYIDVPILILYDTFGSIATCIILGYLSKQVVDLIIKVHKYKKLYSVNERREAEFFIYISPVILGLFVTNGTFLINVYQAILTGIIIGGLVNETKSNYVCRKVLGDNKNVRK